MNNTINCKESYMIYENYIKQSIKLIELSLIKIVSKNLLLISNLDQGISHSLARKISNIPFKIQ